MGEIINEERAVQHVQPEALDTIYQAVQELTKQLAEVVKQLREFKEIFDKARKAGRF